MILLANYLDGSTHPRPRPVLGGEKEKSVYLRHIRAANTPNPIE